MAGAVDQRVDHMVDTTRSGTRRRWHPHGGSDRTRDGGQLDEGGETRPTAPRSGMLVAEASTFQVIIRTSASHDHLRVRAAARNYTPSSSFGDAAGGEVGQQSLRQESMVAAGRVSSGIPESAQ